VARAPGQGGATQGSLPTGARLSARRYYAAVLPLARLPPPGPQAAAHSARLVEVIAREIDACGGWIPFDRYMQLALYAPGLGYYAAGSTKFGGWQEGGDFVTAPELSPLYAAALARALAPVLRATRPWVLEFGAGTGRLAADLIGSLRAAGVEVERYLIVEVSPDLRERQRERLAGLPVQWLDAPPAGFQGAIVANEVLDVMPVQLFVAHPDGPLERGVVRRSAGPQASPFAFADRPPDPALAAAFAALEADLGPFAPGYGSEIGLLARAWAGSLAGWLERGVALLVDYGFPRREYYHRQRLMGTLMCHYRHHSHADPLWWPGLNDITAHVDFSALADAAHAAGLDVLAYSSQASFLIECGIVPALSALAPAERAAAQRLVSEAEMGELFKVLAVGRGYDAPLAGYGRGDRLHML